MRDDDTPNIWALVLIGAAILLLVLTLVGCGGGDDDVDTSVDSASCPNGFVTSTGQCFANVK